MISRDYWVFTSKALACIVLLGCALTGGCRSSSKAARRYALEGKVLSIDQKTQQLIVSHGEIEGYMPAMVMPFELRDAGRLKDLAKGDEISATLVVDESESWLENVSVTRKGTGQPDERDADINALPHVGEPVPDFALTNQDGKKISLSQYRGKALLITFIYTRCPLPDYCPLMSSNFSAIDKALQNDAALYAKTHLLSVSFDFGHDTPSVLRSYGAAYTERYSEEKFEHWEFASGSEEEVNSMTKFFGLRYANDAGQIVHALVTVIVSPDGRIFKIYPYNDWKPADVLFDLQGMKLN